MSNKFVHVNDMIEAGILDPDHDVNEEACARINEYFEKNPEGKKEVMKFEKFLQDQHPHYNGSSRHKPVRKRNPDPDGGVF